MSTQPRECESLDPQWLLKFLLVWLTWTVLSRVPFWVSHWIGLVIFFIAWIGLIVAAVVLKKWEVLWPTPMHYVASLVVFVLGVDLLVFGHLPSAANTRLYVDIILQVLFFGLMLALIARHQGERRWWRWSYPALLFCAQTIRFSMVAFAAGWPRHWVSVVYELHVMLCYVFAVALPILWLWFKHRNMHKNTSQAANCLLTRACSSAG
ncbi:MAG: hypothetical protein FWE40_03300 [Oscillospiraceae bacterium]|nr:hypothetical protein [Oscillospiraceae bacterium]